jgi:hypothetical protein
MIAHLNQSHQYYYISGIKYQYASWGVDEHRHTHSGRYTHTHLHLHTYTHTCMCLFLHTYTQHIPLVAPEWP